MPSRAILGRPAQAVLARRRGRAAHRRGSDIRSRFRCDDFGTTIHRLPMPKDSIVITEEKIHPEAVALLQDYRLCYAGARFSQDALVELVRREQPVAILARYGKITEEVQSASPRLKVIGRHGVGMDAIDLDAARRRGIHALPATGSNSQAVAELALGLMLSCARKISWLDQRMHQGRWDKQGYLGLELAGATLGIVGCGSIGSKVARFGTAIGMKVLVSDPFLEVGRLPPGADQRELDELLSS